MFRTSGPGDRRVPVRVESRSFRSLEAYPDVPHERSGDQGAPLSSGQPPSTRRRRPPGSARQILGRGRRRLADGDWLPADPVRRIPRRGARAARRAGCPIRRQTIRSSGRPCRWTIRTNRFHEDPAGAHPCLVLAHRGRVCYRSAQGHECQQIAPACWPATLQPRWGAPGEDLVGARCVRQARASGLLVVPRTAGVNDRDHRSRTTRPGCRPAPTTPVTRPPFPPPPPARRGPVTHPHAPGLDMVGAGTRVPLASGGTAEYANLDHGASAPALAGGPGHRRRPARAVRQRAPRRRLALQGLHEPVRGCPRAGPRLRRRPRRRRGDLHPAHHRFVQPARALPARPDHRRGLRDRAPRRTAALVGGAGSGVGTAGWSGCPRPTPPRTPSPWSTTRCAAGPRPGAAGDHRRVQRHRRDLAGRRAGPGRPVPRRPDRAGRRATRPAPAVLHHRTGRRLRRPVRAQALRPVRHRRPDRPRRLAGRRPALPDRRRRHRVGHGRRDRLQAAARPARGRLAERARRRRAGHRLPRARHRRPGLAGARRARAHRDAAPRSGRHSRRHRALAVRRAGRQHRRGHLHRRRAAAGRGCRRPVGRARHRGPGRRVLRAPVGPQAARRRRLQPTPTTARRCGLRSGLGTTTEHVQRLVRAVESIAEHGPRLRYVVVDGRPVPAVDGRELPVIAPWQR